MCQFSIIVPCYNIEKNILTLFDLLAIREYSNYEVIFIDDCSKDQTFEILCKTQSLKKEYKNFRCFQTAQNSGPGIARNLGLEYAQGEYIIFCDSDDAFDVECLPKIDKFIQNHTDADMLISPYRLIRNGKIKKIDKYKFYRDEEGMTAESVILGVLGPVAKIYRNQIIQKNQIKFPARWTGEDACFVVNYVVYVQKIYKLDIYYYDYIMNRTSITHTKGIDFHQKTTFEVLKPIYHQYFSTIEIEMFVRTHLLTKAKQMCAASCSLKQIKSWFKEENKKYPNWINCVNIKEETLYKKLIYKAMYKNCPLMIKVIMKLRELFY